MTYKYLVLKCVKFNLERITKENGYAFDIGFVDLNQLEIKNIEPTPAVILVQRALVREYQVAQVMQFSFHYSIVPVVRPNDLEDAEGIVHVLDEFEASVVRQHHADFFLKTAFSSNLDVPEDMRTFHLMNHKLGDAEYYYTKDRAHARIEANAEYEVFGQDSL